MTPNLRAFAQVVRAAEGTAGPDGWRTLYGGSLFDLGDDHPRIKVTASGYTSTAAGAYQILAGTWDDFIRARGPHRFDEQGQDACFEWLVERRGARRLIEEGNLEGAIAACNREWASLPGAPYGQPTRSMGYCHAVWARALPEAPAAPAPEPPPSRPINPEQDAPSFGPPADQPSEDRPVTPLLIPMLAPLLQSLLQVFTPLAQQKLSSALNKATGDPAMAAAMSQQIIGIAQQATGLSDPVEAVAAVKADARVATQGVGAPAAPGVKTAGAVVAQVEARALEWVDKMAPLIDRLHAVSKEEWGAEEASRQAAAARLSVDPSVDWMTRPLIYGALALIAVLIAFVCGIAAWQAVQKGAPSTEVWAAVTGLIGFATGVVTTVYAYRFGSSRQSAAKDVTLAQIAQARR